MIRDADRKDITQISVELTEISSAAREKKLSADRLQGGGFTVTNLGGIGGTFLHADSQPARGRHTGGLKVPPLSPRISTGSSCLGLMLPLSLSYDHRIIDGAEAARFLRWLCGVLEESPGSIFGQEA